MNHISMVTNAPGVEVESITCIVNVSLDERHPNGNLQPQGWNGVKK